MPQTHSTTILTVRHRGVVAIGGDGQVTVANTIMKADAVKIRRLNEQKVITGFAGASVVDSRYTLLLTGNGDVIQPTDGVLGIGSGGNYAVAAARALLKHSSLSAVEIVREALTIAAGIDVFTNTNIMVEELACES
jgi:ATP-dependent HslUV protease, peptidase subunit HslV